MEIIVKQTREVGTSAGVLLPRSWLNKQVVVKLFLPSKEEIIRDVLDILIKNNLIEEIKGIYLFGSYARGDYGSDSDIDILVITQNINKLIDEGNYEIILVSEQNLDKNLPTSLYYISMIREMKVIINKALMKKYFKKNKLNVKKFLMEIENMFKINKDVVEMCMGINKNIPDGTIYSIVLRLRELYLIKCLISNKSYSREDFLKITGEKIYSAYSRVKRDKREINNVYPNEAGALLNLTEKWLKELKESKKELKV